MATHTVVSRKGIHVVPKHYRVGGKHVDAFCREHGIHALVNPCHENPWMSRDHDVKMLNWSVTLVRCDEDHIPKLVDHGLAGYISGYRVPTFGTFFSTGDLRVPGFLGGSDMITIPTPSLVLTAVLNDAYSMEQYDGMTPWRDWADDLGMDPDSMDTLASWVSTAGQIEKLKRFLGDLYDTAMGAFKLDEGFADYDEDDGYFDPPEEIASYGKGQRNERGQRICGAKTSKGTPCQNLPMADGRCWAHRLVDEDGEDGTEYVDPPNVTIHPVDLDGPIAGISMMPYDEAVTMLRRFNWQHVIVETDDFDETGAAGEVAAKLTDRFGDVADEDDWMNDE